MSTAGVRSAVKGGSSRPARRSYFLPVALLSALFLAAGGALWFTERGSAAAPASSAGGPPAAGLIDTGRAPGTTPEGTASDGGAAPADGWSPFFVKGGFSLFLGFCAGYALRFFFKVSVVVLGVFGLLLVTLSYAGAIQVDWEFLSGRFDACVARVREESQALRTFLAGSLPSAALAVTGFVAGLKRR